MEGDTDLSSCGRRTTGQCRYDAALTRRLARRPVTPSSFSQTVLYQSTNTFEKFAKIIKFLKFVYRQFCFPSLHPQAIFQMHHQIGIMELSPLRTFAPGSESSICSLELPLPGTFTPGSESSKNFRSQDLSLPGTFAPKNKSSKNFRSLELSFHGTFVPENESH